MSNVFSLDSIREEAEKEFAPVKIGLSDGSEATLRNLLRLGKADREKALAKLKELDAVGDDNEDGGFTLADIDQMVGIICEVLILVSPQGRKLVKDIDGDYAVLMRIVNMWMEATQPGEAESSPS